MHLVFYKTNDVFVAEEKLQESGIKTDIVPTPVQDKAYCGVCVKVSNTDITDVTEQLSNMKFKVID